MGGCSNAEVVEELKRFIKEQIDGLRTEIGAYITSKIETLNSDLERLTGENKTLADRVQVLERRHRENNLVVFGLVEGAEPIADAVALVEDCLGVGLADDYISGAFRVGKKDSAKNNGKPRPLLIKLVTLRYRQEILRVKSRLKGSGIYISRDQSREEREKAKKLTSHLRAARGGGYFAKAVGNEIQIGTDSFTLEQLERSSGGSNNADDADNCANREPPDVSDAVSELDSRSVDITSAVDGVANQNTREVVVVEKEPVRVANVNELSVTSKDTSSPRTIGERVKVSNTSAERKKDLIYKRLRSGSGSGRAGNGK